jgi:hypothetical protein
MSDHFMVARPHCYQGRALLGSLLICLAGTLFNAECQSQPDASALLLAL